MAKPHKCALPGCNVMTKNKDCCCLEHTALKRMMDRESELEGETKICSACNEEKPILDFQRRDKFRKIYFVTRCKQCEAAGKFGSKKMAAMARARDNFGRRGSVSEHTLSGYLGIPFSNGSLLGNPWW